jgi:RNA recognition motif-containing protein
MSESTTTTTTTATSLKAFVGMLESTVTDEALDEIFAEYGNPTFSKKGRGRVATFPSEELAAKAISELNGKTFDGVTFADNGMRVEPLKPKKKKSGTAKVEAQPSNKAFVGNLDREATTEALEQAFAEYGNPTFKKKGRGHVATFDSAETAAKAISEMNEKVVEGLSYGEKGLRVELPKPRAPRAKKEKSAPAAAEVDISKQAFIGNVDRESTAEALEQAFEQYGNPTFRKRGFYAFATFASAETAAKAISEMNGKSVEGLSLGEEGLTVEPAKPKVPRAKKEKKTPAAADVDTSNQAFVGNLDREATTEALEEAFAQYGNPAFKKRGRGRVAVFDSADTAAKAISEMNGKIFEGLSYGEKGLRVEVLGEAAPRRRKRRNQKQGGEAVDVAEQKNDVIDLSSE